MSGKRRAPGAPVTKTPKSTGGTKAPGGGQGGAGGKGPGGKGPTGPGKGGKPKVPRTRKQKVQRALKWFALTCLAGALLLVGLFVVLYQTIEIPDPNDDFQTETSFIYYADGKTELGRFATQNRDSIPLDEMPDHLQDAVVAAENRTFWSDRGLDPKGIMRAAFSNASGGTTQGASTITQQYVKILYLTQERSYTRKAKEAILSLKLHRQQSKKEILEGYLNTIYFGRGAYGVQAAAKAYFDKPAADLSLRESAVLARVLNNPSRYDPANGEDARERLRSGYERILAGMAETGAIEDAEAEKAARQLPKFPKIKAQSAYGGQKGHVLSMVRAELQRLGFSEQQIEGGGLQVTTTFNRKAMTALEEGVNEAKPTGFPGEKQLHVGAASVEPGTGAVRGIYGGQDFLDSQINWAVSGGQGGSILKPFALVAGLEQGFALTDTFEGNSPITVGDTEVENQGDTDYGSAINLIAATEDSVNTAFVDLTDSMDSGPEKIIEAANKMGIPPEEASSRNRGFPARTPGLKPDLTVSLGSATVSPVNMANAYGTLAAEGTAAEPFIIEKVVDETGEVRYDHKVRDKQAVDPDIAADVSYALQQVVTSGSGSRHGQLPDRPAAGKTGTSTNGPGDVVSSWYTGYTPQLSTSVVYVRGTGTGKLDEGWLPDFEGASGYFGGGYPAATWSAVMTRALEGAEVLDFPEPAYVDGDAPSDGHAPTLAPEPEPTRAPEPPRKPSKKPSKEPSREPSKEPEAPPSTPAPSPPPPPPTTPEQPAPTVPQPPAPTTTVPPAGTGGAPGGRVPGTSADRSSAD
ncbi:transglycosylase domain-containing protein [Nocardioides pantholopis]|uniref:transglycosylase domain-containing protein n=1 Tax=Nocardioides pantholopis TaxID=2483798 RepID=UPI000F095B6C|nr:transglycosylase domain-containing protein [Nocardioides pantholopis]